MNRYQKGDYVTLTWGGPVMMIVSFNKHSQKYKCTWKDRRFIETEYYAEIDLIKYARVNKELI